MGLRVVHSPLNVAGIPWTNVQAQRRKGIDARLVVVERQKLHPEADWSLDRPGGFWGRQAVQWPAFLRLLPRTDVFHFYFGWTLVPRKVQWPILKATRKKSVLHFLGSDIRGRTPEQLAYARGADARIVGSYDALRWIPDAHVVPPGLDLREYTPVPPEERPAAIGPVLWECLVGMVPVTVLTVLTLGAILAGVTTAAEAAALGALGAVVLAICYRKFTWKGLLDACYNTMATTAMVLFLAVSSNVFGAVFAWLGTANWITQALLAAPLPAWGTMSLLLVLIFLLGWPFEWPAIVLIFMPLLAPVAKGLGYDMVWFACVVAVVLQTAFLSPPVAMSAYYLKQVVKDWNLATIYRGMADFMVIQCICVALVVIFPSIAMWFPNWLQERAKAERMREKSVVPVVQPVAVAPADTGTR